MPIARSALWTVRHKVAQVGNAAVAVSGTVRAVVRRDAVLAVERVRSGVARRSRPGRHPRMHTHAPALPDFELTVGLEASQEMGATPLQDAKPGSSPTARDEIVATERRFGNAN